LGIGRELVAGLPRHTQNYLNNSATLPQENGTVQVPVPRARPWHLGAQNAQAYPCLPPVDELPSGIREVKPNVHANI
jgi:hypothetical protein